MIVRAVLVLTMLGAGTPLAFAAAVPGPPSDDDDPRSSTQLTTLVAVQVTAVSGDSVYLDQGRDAGLAPGDAVRLLPLDGTTMVATVRAVSRTSAQAELTPGHGEVEIGTEGEVLVPRARLERPGGEARSDQATTDDPGTTQDGSTRVTPPDDGPAPTERPHPAWEHPPVEWDGDMPLLAPIESRTPEERDPRFRGRLHTQFDSTRDRAGDERTYFGWRTGIDLAMDNPFRRAGVLDLDIELSQRRTDVHDGQDESDSILRLDRLSYRRGGIRGRPDRFEVGRFLQREFPGFGVIDGMEYGHRFSSGSRLGASLGFLPSRTDQMATGDDLQAAVFYRYVADEAETFALGGGVQKTWHNGAADRDLFVGELDYRPHPRLSAHATAWVDYYTSGDDAKSSGFELTQLLFNGRYRFVSGDAVSIFATRVKWPQLLRDDFSDTVLDRLSDFGVTRVGVRGEHRFSRHVRLDGRLGTWTDQDDSGGDAGVRLALRDLLYDQGEVSLDVHQQSGKFSSGLGFRLRADRRFDHGALRASWDTTNFSQEGATGPQADLRHHTLRAGYDWSFGRRWDLSLYLEQRFGDEQDSQAVGFYLQKRL